MKTILLIPLLALLSACCLQKTSPELKDVNRFVLKQRTIRVDFHPYKSIRYQDRLIIQGLGNEDEFRFAVYDLKTGKIDTVFQRRITIQGIKEFMIRNDQLIACLANNQFEIWNENGWKNYQSPYNFFFSQDFRRLDPNDLQFLHEDATYFVYAIDFGEWGGAAFFYHKPSGKTYSFQNSTPVDVLKSKAGYEISISMAHATGFVALVTIRDPLKLELVPDSLNFLKHEMGAKTSQQVYDFWKVNERRNLSFRLFFEQFYSNEADKSEFEYNAYRHYNSLQKHDPAIDFKLDTFGLENHFSCYGSFDFNGTMTYLFLDSMLYLGQIENGKLKRIQDFPEQPVLPYYPSIVEHKNVSHSYSLWTHRAYKDHDLMVNHVWLSVSGTTIYRYNIVRKN